MTTTFRLHPEDRGSPSRATRRRRGRCSAPWHRRPRGRPHDQRDLPDDGRCAPGHAHQAIEIIRARHTGDLETHHGDVFDVDSARIWDLPDVGDRELVTAWNDTSGAATVGCSARSIGQIPID